MFKWLFFGWLNTMAKNPAEERRIFRLWDGKEWKFLDPLVIGRTLDRVCPDLDSLLRTLSVKLVGPPGPARDDLKAKQHEATEKLVAAAREAFGVKPIGTDGGLTEAETITALGDYLQWMAAAAEEASPH